MARGKYAARATGKRETELTQTIAELESKLSEERAARRADQVAATEAVAAAKRDAARNAARMVQDMIQEKAELASNGISAAAWAVMRTAMTRRLAELFWSGTIDWDRVRGDREVVSFISTYGDLRTWYYIADKYGFRSNRRERRGWMGAEGDQRAVSTFLRMIGDIEKATTGAEDALGYRTALDGAVQEGRDRFLKVEFDSVLTDSGDIAPAEITTDDVEVHAEIMRAIEDFQARAPFGAGR